MNEKIKVVVAARSDKDRNNILAAMSEQEDIFIASVEKDEIGAIIKSELLKPDILIVDIQSAGLAGADLVRIVRRRSPSTATIILANNTDENQVSIAVKAGVSGYLLKDIDIDKLVYVVKIVFFGGCYITASITVRVFRDFTFTGRNPEYAAEQNCDFFTPTEYSIITNLAKGYSDDEISDELNLSVGSIRNCITMIKRKTKMKNRVEIVIFSLVFGFIRLENLDAWKEKKADLIFSGDAAKTSL